MFMTNRAPGCALSDAERQVREDARERRRHEPGLAGDEAIIAAERTAAAMPLSEENRARFLLLLAGR